MPNEPLAPEEIQRIINDWYGNGIFTDIDQDRLKAEYLRQHGVETCTICPNFWNNVQTYFRLFLRSQKRSVEMNNKYMIALSIGSLYIAGVGLLVNPGVKSPGTVELTDKVAEDLLKQFPDLAAEHIILNPDFDAKLVKAQADADAKAKKDAETKAKKEADDAKKAADAKSKTEADDAKKAAEAKAKTDAAEAKKVADDLAKAQADVEAAQKVANQTNTATTETVAEVGTTTTDPDNQASEVSTPTV